jgi:phosphoenolpyruvate synthase/pyruvate phosphate dikinase
VQLGGKGANLAEMCRIGLNVPPGFTITTETCSAFHAGGGRNLPEDVWQDVLAAIQQVEGMMGKKFADPSDPLLLSVRSGAAVRCLLLNSKIWILCLVLFDRICRAWARFMPPSIPQIISLENARTVVMVVFPWDSSHKSWNSGIESETLVQISMPGMMDTVLNLGLNDTVVKGLAAKAGERFAYDSYRRFLDMYGNVVLGFDHHDFEQLLTALKVRKSPTPTHLFFMQSVNYLKNKSTFPVFCCSKICFEIWNCMQEKQGVKNDNELSVDALKELVELYKGVYTSHKQQFPTDPLQQLRSSVCAVFESWEGERAVAYRKVNKITGLAGTAVNVQVC